MCRTCEYWDREIQRIKRDEMPCQWARIDDPPLLQVQVRKPPKDRRQYWKDYYAANKKKKNAAAKIATKQRRDRLRTLTSGGEASAK